MKKKRKQQRKGRKSDERGGDTNIQKIRKIDKLKGKKTE